MVLMALLLGLVMTDYPNYGSALAASKADGKPVVLAFTATWCAPCRQLKASTLSDAAVKKELEDNFHFYLVDTDDEKGLTKKFKVSALPTIKVVDSNERELDSKAGIQKPKEFIAWLAKHKK